MIGGEILFAHSEAVAAFRVHVQFGRFVSFRPLSVQGDARRCEAELVVGRGRNKHRRCVGGDGSIVRHATRVDGGDKCGPAFGRVVKGHFRSDRAAGGESDDADTVRRNTPL